MLFYRLLSDHLPEMLPVVYDPTIARAIEGYSHEYRRPRGVYLSVDHAADIGRAFANLGLGPDDVDLIVASDAEEILGIGDWGVGGGTGIAVGKLAVYTAAAGVDPARAVAVALDVGTDNEKLLNDPFYVGNRHSRVRGRRYDDFVDAYVSAATALFPARCCTGRTSAPPTPGASCSATRPRAHLQRRHAGHRRDRAGGHAGRRPRLGHAPARPADRRLRRRYGGHRHRRPAA